MGNKSWGAGHRAGLAEGMAEGVALGRRQTLLAVLKVALIIAPVAIDQWRKSRERAAEKSQAITAD